jgi:hypothetical protein
MTFLLAYPRQAAGGGPALAGGFKQALGQTTVKKG